MLLREIRNVLETYFDEEEDSFKRNHIDSVDDKSNIASSSSLDQEIQRLKKESSKKSRKFLHVKTGMPGIEVVRVEKADPAEIVRNMFETMSKTNKSTFRECFRIVPMQKIVTSKLSQILDASRELIAAHLPKDGPSRTFSVIYRKSNSTLKRDEVIHGVANLVDPKYKVNLKSPDLVILIHSIRSICGISILKTYYRLHEYSIPKMLRAWEEEKKTSSTEEEVARAAAAAAPKKKDRQEIEDTTTTEHRPTKRQRMNRKKEEIETSDTINAV